TFTGVSEQGRLIADTRGAPSFAFFAKGGMLESAVEACMQSLRTPDDRFVNLPGYNFAPHYVEIDGLRLHYIDEGPKNAAPVLLLHGEPSWCYLYRNMVPVLV